MLNLANKQHFYLAKVLVVICSGWLISGSVYALDVSSGQFIQTIYPEALEASSTFTVNDFFDDTALSTRLRNDLIQDIVLGPAPLNTNTFMYNIHGTDFVAGHPDRVPGINSFPSQFQFEADNVLNHASMGRLGLGGVMRFDLPPRPDGTPRYFMLGDWTIEYNTSRTQDYNFDGDINKPIHPADYQVSGWFLRNHIDFPTIVFDVVNQTTFSNSDSFYLSGELAWSHEMTRAFFPETELYRNVSKFVLCAQDDNALAEQDIEQIPCVFPSISLNGKSGNVNISVPETINIAVDLGVASTEQYSNADYFAAFVYQNTLYWLNSDFQWTVHQAAAYQGPLIDFRHIDLPSPAQVIGSLPSGTAIPFYFGVDATQNGQFDAPYRYVSATLQVN
ncbi:hypothetical protein AU255_08665 [Methyloprofundus sedimenti]|uniref:Uncharacterized protein n=1 Tax=Methyloprofundus sedimenti TaxID=1420851 RepID=A0A1V8M8P3_9GAMM|nr:hypothetical protein [Methyloprofundus sedimenti]OQK17917.1 hypothetical protein AU255_08665 [Methyloprofundus sedimenti]